MSTASQNDTAERVSDLTESDPCPEWCRIDHSGATYPGEEVHVAEEVWVELSLEERQETISGDWQADHLAVYPQKQFGAEAVVYLDHSGLPVASLPPREARYLAGYLLSAASTLDGRPNASMDVDFMEEMADSLQVSVVDVARSLRGQRAEVAS